MKPSRGITVFTWGSRGSAAGLVALPSAFHTMEAETLSTRRGFSPSVAQFAATLLAAARLTFSVRATEGGTLSCATLRTVRALLPSRLGRRRALRALVTRMSGPPPPPPVWAPSWAAFASAPLTLPGAPQQCRQH